MAASLERTLRSSSRLSDTQARVYNRPFLGQDPVTVKMIDQPELRPPFFEQAVTLFDILRWRALCQPDRPFLTFLADGDRPEETITFGALETRVRLVAAALRDGGAAPGDRALLLYPQGPDFVVAFLACLAAGVIAVPAYPPRNARHMPRIETILADAGARLILSVATRATASNRGGPRARARRRRSCAPTRSTEQPRRRGRLPTSIATPPRSCSTTSGSTGQPKGVVVSHANLLANLRMVREAFGYDERSDFVSWLPMYHDMGLVGNLLQPLVSSARG